MGRIRFRLPRFFAAADARDSSETSAIVPANAPADPPKKPPQPVLALFGSPISGPETKPKDAFAWEKTKGIE